MICEFCRGSGRIWNPLLKITRTDDQTGMVIENPLRVPLQVPCDACGGSGVASCCEGAVGGPEEVTNR